MRERNGRLLGVHLDSQPVYLEQRPAGSLVLGSPMLSPLFVNPPNEPPPLEVN